MNSLACTCVMILGVSAPGPPLKSTQQQLGDELAEVARNIGTLVRKHGGASIRVGDFPIHGHFPAGQQNHIVEAFRYAIDKYGGVTVKMKTDLELAGKVYVRVDGKLGRSDIKIEFWVNNSAGDTIGEKMSFLTSDRDLMALVPGDNIPLPPAGPDEREHAFVEALAWHFDEKQPTPTPPISKTTLKLGDCAMEVLVKRNGKYVVCPLQAGDGEDEGTAIAFLNRNDEYAVRLFHYGKSDVAAELLIDGLSMFRFSNLRAPGNKSLPRYSHVLVRKGEAGTTIVGWHFDNEQSRGFKITDFAASAIAGEIGAQRVSQDGARLAGTIQAKFRAAWDPVRERAPCPPVATGFGFHVERRYREVRREFGDSIGSLTIRYREKD